MAKLRYSAHFKRDFRQGVKRGCDPEKLRSLLELLQREAPLPLDSRDGPMKGTNVRACRVEPGWLLVYRIKEGVVILMRVQYIKKERPTGAPPMKLWFKTLLRSPVKTALTVLLLAAASFFLGSNLAGWAMQQKAARQVEESAVGVLTAEKSLPKEMANPTMGVFLITDPTNPGMNPGKITNENYHHAAFTAEDMAALAALPYIDGADKRYMTAGVSEDYRRMDNYKKYYNYTDRCILEGTVIANELDEYWQKFNGLDVAGDGSYTTSLYEPEGFRDIWLTDVKLLSGDEAWLDLIRETYGGRVKVEIDAIKPEYIGVMGAHAQYMGGGREPVFCADYDVSLEDVMGITPGKRYVFVLRENPVYTNTESPEGLRYCLGDDSRKGWQPYWTDITDLPENYLETEEFASLRSLIEVTEADRRTFDVVYTDDMASIRRVTSGQITATQGRLLMPSDAGKNVCAVSEAFLAATGLRLGDSLTLKLGNVLMEQYAPLGAVAVTRGRYAAEWTEQSFTIVGSWQDVGDGAWLDRELYWAYSDNTIFVPSSFLPESCDRENHLFRPAEVSFLVGEAANILPFEEEVLPMVEEMKLKYEFEDRNWTAVAEKMQQTKTASLIRLLAFGAAAILAVALTVYLFLIRRKREYAVLRALGSPRQAAARALWLPLIALAVLPVLIGMILARLLSDRAGQGKELLSAFGLSALPSLSPFVYLLAALVVLGLIALACAVYLRGLGRKSPLALMQEKEG